MAPSTSALDSGNPDNEDESLKADRLAARAARFNNKLPGNRYKQLEEARIRERKVFEQQGLIRFGKTELDNAVDMRGTCERMCSEYEREFREYTREIHPFEAGPGKRMDPEKAVAAYSRSDAGAGHGESAILPSDLRTPTTLARTLDYLFGEVMLLQPPSTSHRAPSARKALGYSAGFIRDRTRAIRKEFAMQSSWGQEEAIASFERIARWHILCLRELQEETGTNSDMHIDSAELGRCFTSLRQHYNDRREELGIDLPCPNEPEFRAYMLIFDLAQKSVSIPTAELPRQIIDHPLVKIAWEIRRAAQRNFDSQKEGSKFNSELGENLITRFVRLLKQSNIPYLMSCLVEIRLREIRRSAIRALTRTYPRLRADPIRLNEQGEVVERRMVLINTLDVLLGCEAQEEEESAFEDVDEVSRIRDQEAVDIVRRFELEVYDHGSRPAGVLINLGAYFNDNRDAPYTRRWKLITDKRAGMSFVDVVNGQAGIAMDGVKSQSTVPTRASISHFPGTSKPTYSSFESIASKPELVPTPVPSLAPSAFRQAANRSASPFSQPVSEPVKESPSKPLFSFAAPPVISTPPPPATKPSAVVAPPNLFSFDFGAPQTPSAAKTEPPPPIFTGFNPSIPGPSKTPPPKVSSPSPIKLASPPKPSPAAMGLSSKALGKRPALSSSVLRRSVLGEEDRARQRQALPAVREMLIDDVISSLLEDMSSDLVRVVKQEVAARTYAKAKARRKEDILQWSTLVYDLLRAEVTRNVAREVLLHEIRIRMVVREVIRHWSDWAKKSRLNKEINGKMKEATFLRLSRMGLGGDAPPLPMEQEKRVIGGRDLGDLGVDVELRESARVNDRFHTPSTFLSVVVKRVGLLIAASDTYPASPSLTSTPPDVPLHPRPKWDLILSLASDSATPSNPTASQWLVGKFSPMSAEDEYERYGVVFDTRMCRRYDDLPKASYAGLVVFEVPLRTDDPKKQQENLADAQDRFFTLVKSCQTSLNRYVPALLLISWDGENVDEIANRLEIEEDIAAFERVEVLRLEQVEDLDFRLEKVLEDLMPVLKPKTRVVIQLEDVVRSTNPAWERYLSVISLVLSQRPSVSGLALAIFASGVDIVNQLAILVRTPLGKMEESSTSTFNPIVLPRFTTHSATSLIDVADTIAEYLEDEIFAGIDDITLAITPLHHAAFTGSVLPIQRILASFGYLVFGELGTQTMPLQSFWAGDEAGRIVDEYLTTVSNSFDDFVDDRIHNVTRSLNNSTPRRMPRTSISPTSTYGSDDTRSVLSPSRGVKRTRGDENVSPSMTESKAAKNARLLKAMEEVNMTLGRIGMDGYVEGVIT